jgi:hypothetical protein
MQLPFVCGHGYPTPKVCPACLEIDAIVADDPDRALRLEQRFRTVSLEVVPEGTLDRARRRGSIGGPRPRPKTPLRPLFFSETEIELAWRFRAISSRERQVLLAYLELSRESDAQPEHLGPRRLLLNWTGIARRIGLHRRTTQVLWRAMEGRFGHGPVRVQVRPVAFVSSHERRSKRFRMLLRQQVEIGRWSRRWSRPVTSRPERQLWLESGLPHETRKLNAVRAGEMNGLCAALAAHLSHSTLVTGPLDQPTISVLMASSDWSHNTRWAERRIRPLKKEPQTYADALRMMVRGLPLCGNCRTPILVGCRLRGRRLNAGRRICNDACKMAAFRRKRWSKE